MNRTCKTCGESLPIARFEEYKPGHWRWKCRSCRLEPYKTGLAPGGRPGMSRTGEDICGETSPGRTCGVCGHWKPRDTYSVVRHTGNLSPYCNDCARERNRAQYAAEKDHPDKKEARRRSGVRTRAKLRAEVVAAYGGKCMCCGESQQEFLTLDHLDNDGAQHRRGEGAYVGVTTALWTYARQQSYPDTLQLLCWNCNCAKGLYGVCPHDINNQLAAKDYARRA